MNSEMYDDVTLEKKIKAVFGVEASVKSMVVRAIPVAPAAHAWVFLSTKGLMHTFIHGSQRLTLGDIKKILVRMGLKAELFLPPRKDRAYFDDIGRRKFQEVFPGRTVVNDQDLIFYRTLAPYNPALIQISEVRDGQIKQYDADAVGNWRTTVQFSYRRIKTV